MADLEKWNSWKNIPWGEKGSRAAKTEAAFAALRLLREKSPGQRKAFIAKLKEKNLLDDVQYTARVLVQHPEEAKAVRFYLETGKEPPENFENKAAEGILGAERVAGKNLARDKNVSTDFYQKLNPDKEFVNYYGQIMARKKGSDTWRPIDPVGLGEGSFLDKAKEALMDTLDVSSDIGQGLLETVGSAGGGIAGFFVGGKPGALGGAALGGGSMAALSDYLRTSAGSNLGMAQTPNMKDAGEAFQTGALASLLFGSGATKPLAKSMMASKPLRGLASRYQAKKALTDREVMQRLMEAQSGIPVGLLREAPETIVGMMSSPLRSPRQGVRELKALKEYHKEFKDAVRLGSLEKAQSTYDNVKSAIRDRKTFLQNKLSDVMVGKEIDISPIRKRIEKLVADLPQDTAENRRAAEAIRQKYKSILPSTPDGEFIDVVPLKRATELKMDILSANKEYKKNVVGESARDISSGKVQVGFADTSNKIVDSLDARIDRILRVDNLAMSGTAKRDITYGEFLQEWKKLSDAERALGKKSPFSKKLLNTTSDSPTAEEFRQKLATIDNALGGTAVQDDAVGISLASKYGSAKSPMPVKKDSGEISSATVKKTLGGLAGTGLGAATGYGLAKAFALNPYMIGPGAALLGGAAGMAASSPTAMRFVSGVNRRMGAPFRQIEDMGTPINPLVAGGRIGSENVDDILATYGQVTQDPIVSADVPQAVSPWLNMPEYRRNLGLSPYPFNFGGK
jgi:hypothetical protein